MSSVEDIIRQHESVCWYPSAGADFRVLMFLSQSYFNWKNVPIEPDREPDLFILSDCCPQSTFYSQNLGMTQIEELNGTTPCKVHILYQSDDGNTNITVKKTERLEDLEIPLSPQLGSFNKSENYGQTFYLQTHVKSKQLGEWDTDVLYLLTENTGFAFQHLIKKQIPIDYIVRVRYGDQFGGSFLSGEWLLKLIHPLQVKYFLSNKITESSFSYVPEVLKELYPEYEDIWGKTDVIPMNGRYCVDERLWSNQGDIIWYETNNG